MAVRLPNGAIISVGDVGTAITVTVLTNANPAVATATAHGLADNDIVVVTSGWAKIDGRVARVASSDSGTFAYEDFNTSNTTRFPAGTGIGSVKEVTGWTQISQVLNSTTEGGEQQFLTYAFLEDGDERRIPTTKSPVGLTLILGDDSSLAWYDKLAAADDDREPRPIRIALPSGDMIYYNAYCTLNRTPSLTVNELMGLQATFSLVGPQTRYNA